MALADGDDLHQAAARCRMRSVHARFLAFAMREQGLLDDDDRVVIPQSIIHPRELAPPQPKYRKQPIPRSLREAVLVRDDHTCVYCGQTEDELRAQGIRLAVDHVVAEWKGGPMTMENLVASCVPCNSSKGTSVRPRRELREGGRAGGRAA